MDKKFKAQEKRAKREERKNAPAQVVDEQALTPDEEIVDAESSELP